MARTGIARLRHFSHRTYGRMRRQKVAPRYLQEQAVRLSAAGDGPDSLELVSVEPASDTLLFLAPHGLKTGDGPYEVKSTGTIPGGLAAGAEYYIQDTGSLTCKLTLDKRRAVNGAPVNITSAGTGTISINRHVADPEAVLSWHDERPAELVSTVDDVDNLP